MSDFRSRVLGTIIGILSRGSSPKREPVAFLYGHVAGKDETPTHSNINGVDYVGWIGPALPVVEGYEFATIVNDDGVYILGFSKIVLEAYDSGEVDLAANAPTFKYEDGQWLEISWTSAIGIFHPIWANYAIYYKTVDSYGDLSGALLMETSDPIPVYE